MTNLTTRLRSMPSSVKDACRTMEEAADEIERLRRDLKGQMKIQESISDGARSLLEALALPAAPSTPHQDSQI